LIPKKAHSLSKKRAELTDEELSEVILVCRTCHDAIHKFYDERTLALELNTLEKLLNDEKLKRHFKWVSKLKKNY
jgi:predicted HNH restriction endonuclease